VRAARSTDGLTLLAAYHTAFNVVGVAVLLPAIERFTRLVERLLPEPRSGLSRGLDPAALASPVVAIEAVRRTVALAVRALCEAAIASLRGKGGADADLSIATTAQALRQAQDFMADVGRPPASQEEELRLTSTVHALDHALRLADLARDARLHPDANDALEAVQLCQTTLASVAQAVSDVAEEMALSGAAAPIMSLDTVAAAAALAEAERGAQAMGEFRAPYRKATLGAVAKGQSTAEEAMARVDFVRRLDSAAHHAWRAAAHLHGRGDEHAERPALVD
jgi:phosphate:Na+ symporter